MTRTLPKDRKPWTRGDRLMVAALVTLWVTIVFLIVVEAQLQARQEILDDLQDSVLVIETSSEEIKINVQEIEDIARSFQEDDEPNPELVRVFQMIEEIHEAIVGEGG